MKLAITLVGLSMAVMVVMIFQAVRQELDLRNLKSRMMQSSVEVKRKEEAIAQLKDKTQQLKSTLTSVNAKMDELKKKKQEALKLTEDFGKSLQTCNSEKARGTHFQKYQKYPFSGITICLILTVSSW